MMVRLVKESKPTCLIVLGDVKDAIAKVAMEEWRDIPEFFETLQKEVADIQVVVGNHDGNLEPLLPENVKIHPSTGTVFGGFMSNPSLPIAVELRGITKRFPGVIANDQVDFSVRIGEIHALLGNDHSIHPFGRSHYPSNP